MKLLGKVFLLFVSVAILLGGPLLWTVRKTAHQIDLDELDQEGTVAVRELATRVAPEFPRAREAFLLPMLQTAQEQTSALYVAVMDSTGRVLAHTNVAEKGRLYRDANTHSDLQLDKPASRAGSYNGAPIMEVAGPVLSWSEDNSAEDFLLSGKTEPARRIHQGIVRLGLPLTQVLEREGRLFHRITWILLVTGTLGILLVFFFVRRMLRPVQWLSSGTLRVAQGDYGISVPVLSQDELGELAISFNHMSQVLSETTVSKNFLDDVLSHMIDPLMVMDMDGTLRMVNQATLSLLGYSREELKGQSAHMLFLGKNGTLSGDQQTSILKGSVRNLELEFLTKSGAKVSILFSSSFLKNEAGVPTRIIAGAKDMTERKRLEGLVRQADKMSAVGQLAAGVAHEINNPLGVILGFSQAVVRRLQPNDPLELPLKSIEKEAIRCRNLVQDLLTFSRASKIDREPVDINRAVEGAFSLVIAQARMTRVNVTKELAAELPRVMGNLNQIQQIIINLCNNALDAMGSVSGQLTVKTEVLSEGALMWVCLKVIDTGPGIPPETVTRIFEPFFTTKAVGKGTGLGLSLVHEIVKKHSGSIGVESHPGLTEFCIKFPVRPLHAILQENHLIATPNHEPTV
jgi:PAS domain S-box-containing protein